MSAVGSKTVIEVRVCGLTIAFDDNSFGESTDIVTNFRAYNYETRTLIDQVSFASLDGTITDDKEGSVTATGLGNVNGVTTELLFEAESVGGVVSFEISDLDHMTVLANCTSEPGRSAFLVELY